MRPTMIAALLLAAWPALAQQEERLRLACRADDPAMNHAPFTLSLDLAGKNGAWSLDGRPFSLEERADSLILKGEGGETILAVDRLSGRFQRLDKQIVLSGTCERTLRKF